MSIFESFLLGVIQGLTEFLPISSSGHLVIIPRIFSLHSQPLAFDTTLHLGTAVALIIYFWKDIWHILLRDRILGIKILVGSVPAGILGFLFEDYFEGYFRGVPSVLVFVFFGTVLVFVAEKFFSSKSENLSRNFGFVKSFFIGLFQSLALFPGVSRSGATVSGGMFFGLSRESAAKFSFLLSIPIVGLAGVYKLVSSFSELGQLSWQVVGTGFFSSFLTGFLSVWFLLKYLKNHGLWPFILYRLILCIILLVFII